MPTIKNQNEFLTTLLDDIQTMIILSMCSMDALYENSKAFDAFLKKKGMDRILRNTDLKMRLRHTIVPHVRIYNTCFASRLIPFHSELKCHCMAHQMLFQSSLMMRAGTVMCVVLQLIHITNFLTFYRHIFCRSLGPRGTSSWCADKSCT